VQLEHYHADHSNNDCSGNGHEPVYDNSNFYTYADHYITHYFHDNHYIQ